MPSTTLGIVLVIGPLPGMPSPKRSGVASLGARPPAFIALTLHIEAFEHRITPRLTRCARIAKDNPSAAIGSIAGTAGAAPIFSVKGTIETTVDNPVPLTVAAEIMLDVFEAKAPDNPVPIRDNFTYVYSIFNLKSPNCRPIRFTEGTSFWHIAFSMLSRSSLFCARAAWTQSG